MESEKGTSRVGCMIWTWHGKNRDGIGWDRLVFFLLFKSNASPRGGVAASLEICRVTQLDNLQSTSDAGEHSSGGEASQA